MITVLIDAIRPVEPREPDTLEMVARHALVLLQYVPRSSASTFPWRIRILNWCVHSGAFERLRPLTRLSREATRRHLRSIVQSRWLPVWFVDVRPARARSA